RPWRERLVRSALAAVLPYPSRFAAALAAARSMRPVAALLPARARRVLRLLPAGGKETRTRTRMPLVDRNDAGVSRDTPSGPTERRGGSPAAGQDSGKEARRSGETQTPRAPLR